MAEEEIPSRLWEDKRNHNKELTFKNIKKHQTKKMPNFTGFFYPTIQVLTTGARTSAGKPAASMVFIAG